MSKLLTISIAAYNVEKTIEECLDSFLPCKHLDDLEILVINDGSHDRTVEIVSEYEKKYPGIIKLVNKENGGHGSTINKSLSIATGKFFKVIDGDDWVNPDELDKLCDWLKKTDADLVINGFKWCYPNYQFEQHDEKYYNLHVTYLFEEMLRVRGTDTPFFMMHAITIRTVCLRQTHMHIKEKCFYADNEFNLYSYLAAKTISFNNSCAYQYRMGQSTQSVSSEGWYKHLEDYFAIFEDLAEFLSKRIPNNAENPKDKYLIGFLEMYYNGLFSVVVDKITRNGKDYLLINSLEKLKIQYKNLYMQMHLNSITNRIVSKKPALMVPFMRYFKKTIIFKVLKGVKTVIK